jgi:hypothetical protein
MRRKLLMHPAQVEHPVDLAHQVIPRHDGIEIKLGRTAKNATTDGRRGDCT